MMAGFLYPGAGIGMSVMGPVRRRAGHGKQEMWLTRKDLPYTPGMVVLDIAAPVFLMPGLRRTAAANASLLSSFEIVATSLIAMLLFRVSDPATGIPVRLPSQVISPAGRHREKMW